MSNGGVSPLQEVLKALNHPLRRRILRALHDGVRAKSPIQLSRELKVPVSNVSYHVRVLRDKGVVTLISTRPVRGSSEHFYSSTLADHAVAVQLLESTAGEDPAP